MEIITNGLLLTEAMMDQFIRLRLDVLWFSVDSLHTDANGKPSNLLPKIRKLHYAREMLHSRTPETGFVFVATRANLQELPDLVRGAVSYGIARYMVTNLLPYSEDVCDQTLYGRTLDQMHSRPSYWSPIIQLPRMDWNEDTRQALYQVLHSGQNVRIRNVGPGDGGGSVPVHRGWRCGRVVDRGGQPLPGFDAQPRELPAGCAARGEPARDRQYQ